MEDYHAIVPVPMDLGLILRRLEKVNFFLIDTDTSSLLNFPRNIIFNLFFLFIGVFFSRCEEA